MIRTRHQLDEDEQTFNNFQQYSIIIIRLKIMNKNYSFLINGCEEGMPISSDCKRSDHDRDNSFSRQSTADTNFQSLLRKVSRAIIK